MPATSLFTKQMRPILKEFWAGRGNCEECGVEGKVLGGKRGGGGGGGGGGGMEDKGSFADVRSLLYALVRCCCLWFYKSVVA